MAVADPVKTASGRQVDIRPFRAWLRRLEARERVLGTPKPRRVVAERLGVIERRVYAWLNEGVTINEGVVDRAASREGSMMLEEILAMPFEEDEGAPEPERRERAECATPGCGESRNGTAFCVEHGLQLARIREELEADGALMSANGGAQRRQSKARRAKTPTCGASSCWEPRESGHRFCPACEELYDEEDYT